MKKFYAIIVLLLVFSMLFASCAPDFSDSEWKSETLDVTSDVLGTESEFSDTTESSEIIETTSETVDIVKFGGISISEITEIGYHGEELKESAQRISEKLKSLGAGEIKVFEGIPSNNAYAIELGCDNGDSRMLEVKDNEAIITSQGGWILAAVKGNSFSHKYAANLLESIIGDENYTDMFTEKKILHDVQKINNVVDMYQVSGNYSNMRFEGTTIGDATAFNIGDEITFEIKLFQGNKNVGCNRFKYQIICDDGKNISGSIGGSSGALRLTTTITTPGFVRVIVNATNSYGNVLPGSVIYEGGAGASINDINQSIAEPEDFDEFWVEQLKKLDEIEAEIPQIQEIPSTKVGYKAYDVQINCLGNMPASGVLTIPENAEAGSLKAKMQFIGFSAPAPLSPIYEENTMVFYINPHGVPNYGKNDAYYKEFHESIKTTIGDKEYNFGFNPEQNLSPETTYFLNMILRDVQAARYLLSLPEYDGEGIEFYCGSMGAMQATCVAALIGENNVKKMNLSYPWLSNFGCATVGMMGPDWGPEPITNSGELTKGILYFDPVNHAKRIKCEVNIESCLGDYICPPSGQVVLYKALASKNKSLKFYQNSTHAYTSPNAKIYVVK